MQNTSHAVMSQRSEPIDGLDDFPTPPWATRALIEYIIEPEDFSKLSCLELACNKGHMSKVLEEYFSEVRSSDIHDYGYGQVDDFINTTYPDNSFDWVITNPPFNKAEEFVLQSLPIARKGVAIFARSAFLESIKRYERIFKKTPPSIIGQFVERVPIVKGRLDEGASTATAYAWFVWNKGCDDRTVTEWIPPCRKNLEQNGDYPQ